MSVIKAGLRLVLLAIFQAFPKSSVASFEKTHTYSGGTASELHRFPFSLYLSKEPLQYSVDFIIHENERSRLHSRRLPSYYTISEKY